MKTILLFTFTVISQIHHGRLFQVDDPITLTEREAAELADHLDLESKRDADPNAVPGTVGSVDPVDGRSDENGKLLDRIVELQADLDAANKARATIIDENAAIVAERDKTIEELNSQLANRESDLDELTNEHEVLKAENETLKTDLISAKEAAAPKAKDKK